MQPLYQHHSSLLKCSCMCDIQEILCSEARERNIHTETKNEEETRHKPNDMSRRPCTKYDIKISTIVNICWKKKRRRWYTLHMYSPTSSWNASLLCKDTPSWLQKLLSFRYQKPNQIPIEGTISNPEFEPNQVFCISEPKPDENRTSFDIIKVNKKE